jgi:transposase
MEKATRRRYTLEYKQEAVRLVASGQKVGAAAKALGIVEQTLANWVKAAKAGQLRGLSSEQLSAERMENIRLRAELARVTMERDILGKVFAVAVCEAVAAIRTQRRLSSETPSAAALSGSALSSVST